MKTGLGQHQPISSAFSIALFYKSWKRTWLSTSFKASVCQGAAEAGSPARQGEPGAVSGSRADKNRDLTPGPHPTTDKRSDQSRSGDGN